jgi:hypothetical protein
MFKVDNLSKNVSLKTMYLLFGFLQMFLAFIGQ